MGPTKRARSRRASTRRTSTRRTRRSPSRRSSKRTAFRRLTGKAGKQIDTAVAIVVGISTLIALLQQVHHYVQVRYYGGEAGRNCVNGKVTSVAIGALGRGNDIRPELQYKKDIHLLYRGANRLQHKTPPLCG